MGSRLQKALTERGNFAVGNLNSIKIKTLAHGALVEGVDISNFTMVELGVNASGERTCKQLSDAKNKGYLIASPEALYIGGESLSDFYNAVGERARIVILEEGYTRFETSAFALSVVTEVAVGQVAHFDVTTKKFLVHDGTHADYATAKAKFLVVADTTLEGVDCVRLEVIEA